MNPRDDGNGYTAQPSVAPVQAGLEYDSSSLETGALNSVPEPVYQRPKERFAFLRYNKRAMLITTAVAGIVIIFGGITLALTGFRANDQSANQKASDKFAATNLAVTKINSTEIKQISQADRLNINGQLDVGSTLVLVPTSVPKNPTIGQMYFDKATNSLNYYNGSAFVNLGDKPAVTSFGGVTGAITTSSDLVLNGNQLTLANNVQQLLRGGNVTSVQGQTGNVQFAAGSGIGINGTTIINTGVTSVVGTNGAQVTSAGGAVTIALPQLLGTTDSPTFASLNLSSALSVASGGTGLSSLAVNQLLIGGNSPNTITQLANAVAGQCLVSNGVGAAPTFQSCTGAGGVATLDGLTGPLTIANTSGAGSTINIDNAVADGGTKGIAAFNSTNFSSAAGVINTIQNINTTATPTFAAINLSSALTVANGGTGSTTAGGARTNLGAAASGVNSDITSLSGLTTALSVGQGGTGSTTAGGARSNLGAAASGANNDITSLSGLTTALSVSQGGTGFTSVTANQILIGGAGNTITQLANGSSGQCLISNGAGSAPTFQTCTGAGGVSSIDGLTGAISIANTSGSGATITIDNAAADGTTKGIAAFNSTNFSAVNGVINTIQGIATTSTPTFASLTLTSALSVGNGGTGSTTAGGARSNLGAAASGANSDITSLGGLTTALSIGQGGTGSTTASGARTNLGAAASGANSDITSLTGLTTALSVSQGGTGLTTITANQILIGGAGNTVSQLSNGTSGQCLVSNGAGSAPSFQTCTGAGGVSSVNGLTGALTLANSSGAGATITIDNAAADGTTKGIAAFSSTNFNSTSGVISIKTGGVTTTEILDATITATDIANSTITGGKIANNTIANGNLVNSSLTVTAGSGLTGGGSISLGSSASLSVVYGSAAGTAVQGNTTFTCPVGTGNLSGGGDVITLGTGGSCSAIDITSSPVFAGTLQVQGSGGITVGANSVAGVIKLSDGSATMKTASITVNTLASNQSYALPATGGTICVLEAGNCTGTGSGAVTTSGTSSQNYLPKFNNAGATTIGNSSIYNDATGVSVGGSSPAALFNVGATNQFQVSTTGAVTAVGVNAGAGLIQGTGGLTISGTTTLSSLTSGGGQCLTTNGTGVLSLVSCLSGSGGGSGGVVSLNGLSGTLSLANASGSGSTVTIDNAAADGTTKGIAAFNAINFTSASGVINTVQNINSTATPTFGGLTLTTALTVGNGGTGATTASGARTNLGAAASGANSDITSLAGLTTALSVSQGGTGLTSVTANQILLGGASNTITQLANGTSGQCLVSNGAGSAPSFQTCTGAGGVSSVDGLTGAITIANTSGSGGTITINDAKADGTTKGIAAFDSTNFTDASGIINTIQGIATTSTPTFASLTLTSALSITNGGTGSATASGARTNLGAAASGANSDITSLSGLTTALSVGQGGTGSTTAAGARTNLGAAASGANSDITSLTGLTTALSVSQGGTGLTTITANQILLGGAGNTVTQLANGTSGQCLVSNGAGSAPSFQTCTGAGGVSSVNGLAGALTLANSTGAGSTITINDAAADGATKGIAAFNAINFTSASGVINTVQDINTTATPTFGGLSLSTALTVGNGGTGATTASGARTNLGAAASGANSDITSLSGLTTALSVSQGGTGLTSVTANQILIGGAGSTITQLASGTSGQCLVSNGAGSAPSFQTCTGAGGVSSLNGLTGSITLANSSGAAGTITIDNAAADGTTKGIAAFNSTNFSAASGVINTIQGIATTSTPTFAGISINGGGTIRGVTINTATATDDQIIVSVTAGGAARFNGTITNVDLTANRTYTLPDESGTICLQNSNNCGFATSSASGNYIQNQNVSAQASSNFWISGNGKATDLIATGYLYSQRLQFIDGSGSTVGGVSYDANGNVQFGGLNGGGSGANNIAIGNSALQTNSSGSNNIALGQFTLGNASSGDHNIALGFATGSVSGGNKNISIGYTTGRNVGTGSDNAFFGSSAGTSENGWSTLSVDRSTAIGYNAQVTASDALILGSVASGTKVGIGITSPQNLFSVSPVSVANNGTQSGTTLTVTPPIFAANMVGSTLLWSDGTMATVTGFISATQLTLSTSASKTGDFRIHYAGLQVAANGNVGIGTINPASALDVSGAIQGSSSLTLGVSNATNGTIVLKNSANANAVTFQSAAQTGNYTLTIPVMGANDTVCLATLGNCAASGGNFIQNQNASQQATANFWISGMGRADTSILTPVLDIASAGTLAIGNTNASTINIATNNAGHTINIASGTNNQTVLIGSTSGSSNTTLQSAGAFTFSTAAGSALLKVLPGEGLAIGASVGGGGLYNYAIGYQVLASNVSGNGNIGIGHSSMASNISGNDNVGIGHESLAANTTGSENVAVGSNSLTANTTGNLNVAVGKLSLSSNTTGSTNTATGFRSLWKNTTGGSNTAVGTYSLQGNTTGEYNTAVGAISLDSNTTGSYNVSIGAESMHENTTGSFNIALGYSSLRANTTGQYNDAIGYESLLSNTTGDNNIAFGSAALRTNSTGARNIAIGRNTLYANTTGIDNAALGFSALQGNTTGSRNVAFGSSLQNNTTGSYNVALGHGALNANVVGGENVAIGSNALLNSTADQLVAIGADALLNNTSGVANTAVGYRSLRANTTGNANTAQGTYSLLSNTTGDANTAFGVSTLFSNTTGANNTAIGSSALYQNTTGQLNVAIGQSSLLNNTTGQLNTAVGSYALNASISGSNNVAVGYGSAGSLTTGGANASLGYGALGANQTGSNNAAFGASALVDNTTGSDNVSIGSGSGTGNITGIRNVFLGAGAGYGNTGSSSVFLGYAAGYGETNSDRLYIENSASNTPLIYGEFNNDFVRINGSFEVTAGVSVMSGTINSRAKVLVNSDYIGDNSIVVKRVATTADSNATTFLESYDQNSNALVVRAAASQAVNIFEIQDSAGAALLNVDANGILNAKGLTVSNSGNVAFQRNTTDYSATGTQDNINFGTGALFRITSASALTINGIANGSDGRIITLINASASTMVAIADNASATAANKITTGTGSSVTLAPGAAITLVYDSSASLWRVNGSPAGATGGSYVNLQATTPGTAQTGNLNVSGTGIFATAIQAPILDVASGGINIGTVGASGVNISRTGTNTNIQGALIVAEAATFNGNITVAAGKSFTITGGVTGTRPGSPTEGMVYFDTTTKKLLVYSNGKWQADRSDAVLVAASDSSQVDKDAADYVGDGNTGAAGDGDQVQVNNALTAGAGKKVVLLAGTYTFDDTASVPNNTTLSGVGDGTLIVAASGTGALSLIANSDQATGTGVVVQDMRLDGNKLNRSGGAEIGINFSNLGIGGGSGTVKGGRVQGVNTSDFDDTGISIDTSTNTFVLNSTAKNSSYGILILGGTNITISNNITSGNTAGISIQGPYQAVIEGNTSKNDTSGMDVSTTYRMTFTGNMIEGSTTTGLTINEAYESTFTSNSITDSLGNGVEINGPFNDNTFSSNVVSFNNQNGMYFVGGIDHNSFTGNSFYQNNLDAFVAYNATANTFNGNKFSYNGGRSLKLDNANNNTVSGNNFYDNSPTDINAIYLSNSDFNTITGNTIYDFDHAGTAYAINITDSASAGNYLADNTYNAGTIYDAGTGTISGGQLNGSGNYLIQPAGTIELLKNTNVTGTLSVSGLATLSGGITVTSGGNVAFQRNTTNYTATGIQDNVNFGTGALFRITSASTVTINGIANGADGRVITLMNASGNTVTLANNASGNAANNIVTGTGSNISLLNGAAITLMYDNVTSVWRVIGSGSGVGGGTYVNLQATTPGAAQTGNLNVTGTGIFGTSALVPSLDVASAGTLSLGTTTATAISIGTASATTTFNGNITVAAGKTIRIIGDTTANRPGSPSEGMLFYDTTTKKLLVYANGKWQADRSTATKIVGTSASGGASSAVASVDADGADYVNTSTTSAQTVINSAITSLPSDGGSVYLMEGTYIVDGPITLRNNLKLVGAGAGTILKLKNGINANINMLENSGSAGLTLENITLDGNKANNSSGQQEGLYVFGGGSATQHGLTINSITVKNFRSTALDIWANNYTSISNSYILSNGGDGIDATIANNEFSVTGNHVSNNSGYGIYASGNGVSVTGNTLVSNGWGIVADGSKTVVSGNSVKSTTNGGIAIGSNVTGVTVTGNNVTGGAGVGIVANTNASHNTITGNTVTANAGTGIQLGIGANYNLVSSNKLYDNGGTGGSNHIEVDGSYNNIADNVINDTAGSGYAIAIISFGYTPVETTLSNNTYSGTGASSISDAGTGTIYSNQRDGNGNLVNRTPGGTFNIGTMTSAASLTLQGGIVTSQLPAPTLSATVTNVGTAGSTTYRYQVTATDGTGETTGSTVQQTTTGNATLSGTNYNTITWTAVPGAYQYNIYKCSGAACTPLKKTSVAGNITSYDDQSAGSPVGTAPGSNTTGGATFAGTVQSSKFDTASAGSLSIGTTNATSVLIGGNATTTISVGQSTTTNTVNIGTGNLTSGTQTINIGTGVSGTAGVAVSIGSNNGGSSTTLRSGSGGILLSTNGGVGSTTGTIIQSATNNSTAAFQVQNAGGSSLLQVDTTNSNITLLGNNSGEPQTWQTTTPLSTGAQARDNTNAVTYNGYLYMPAGDNGSAVQTSVAAIKIKADGSLDSTWTTTGSSVPTRTYVAVAQANGYIYIMGGSSVIANTNVQSDVYYAKINTDGTVGAFTATASLPAARKEGTAVALNGYMYFLGGNSSSTATPTASSTVYYAKINTDGTLGTWATASNGLPGARFQARATVANGFIYLLGGNFAPSSPGNNVYYAKPSTTGNITTAFGSETTNVLPDTRSAGAAYAANGYLYYVGGEQAGVFQSSVYYAPLNGNGSVAAWSTANNSLPSTRETFGHVVVNGYLYAIGGFSGGVQTTAWYSSLSRVKVGGALDLVGLSGEYLTDGRTGGELTAGNTRVVGTLDVQDVANFMKNATVQQDLIVNGSAAVAGTIYTNTIDTAAAGTLSIGGTNATTVTIGNASLTSGTQTFNLGSGASGTGVSNVFIGSLNSTSATTIRGGSGGLTLAANGGVGGTVGTLVQSATNNSTGAFRVQNSAGANLFQVDTTNNNVTILGNNAGEPQPWSTGTPLTTGAQAREETGAVYYNGFIYLPAGDNGSAVQTSVAYIKVKADGSLDSSWATTGTSVPTRTYTTVAQANGYIYIMGGASNVASTNVNPEVYYAKINADGTVGTFATTQPLPAARKSGAAVVLNGYMYYVGGDSSATGTPSGTTTVYYAKINPDGTLGAWAATSNPLPTAGYGKSGVAANGYIYYIRSGSPLIYYVKPSPTTGNTTGAWSTESTNQSPGGPSFTSLYANNGYLYEVGGEAAGAFVTTVYYTAMNTNGSLSAWSTAAAANSLPAGRSTGAFTQANGYMYYIGGYDGSAAQSSAYYTSLPRLKVGAALDLVGFGGEYLTDGRTGGDLTAGSTKIIGTLEVNDMANFAGIVSIQKDLLVGGSAAFKSSSNSTTAFRIQDSSSTDLMIADTTNSIIKISGTTTTFATLQIDNAHFKSTQTNVPTIGTPTNCATSPTAAVSANSTDSAGSFRITSGTGGGQTTCDTVFTFNKAYGAAPKSVIVVAETTDGGTGTAAARQLYVSATSTTTFTVKMNSAPAGASEINWFYYWVVE